MSENYIPVSTAYVLWVSDAELGPRGEMEGLYETPQDAMEAMRLEWPDRVWEWTERPVHERTTMTKWTSGAVYAGAGDFRWWEWEIVPEQVYRVRRAQ